MNTVQERTEPQNAWLLWSKLNELQALLWENYSHEFMQEIRKAETSTTNDSTSF